MTDAASAAFPRSARVRTRGEFTEIFEGGRRSAHPLLSLHWLRDARPPRLGLAVSRKVDPHAVGRNRIKRILRDDFRKLRCTLAPGAYVIVARSAAATVDGDGLRIAFRGLLQRSGALLPSDPTGTMPPANGR